VRAVVTGGAGFIGSHLADALVARGDEVHVVDDLSAGKREQVPEEAAFSHFDVRDSLEPVFNDMKPEVCFHLAAQIDVRVATERPLDDARINVLGMINVLEAARRHGTQVVFASTGGAIYGESDGPLPETAPLDPISPYGVSKLAAEEYLATYNRLYGANHIALRYSNVYGPRQDAHGEAGVVAIFFRAFKGGWTPVIFGDGEQTRDFVYVDDVVAANLSALGRSGVYNVGTGVETSVNDLYAACVRVAGVSVEPEQKPERPGEIQRSVVDPSLAGRELGWEPATPLEVGLAETWRSIAG
jgi:UDP-glucose 4-epimerase